MESDQSKTKTFLFEIEFHARTTKRRRDQRGREFMHCVALDVSRVTSETYRLKYIETFPLMRGCGNASMAMDWLCRIADQCAVQLELNPLQLEDSGLNLFQLTMWYQRFGFERIGLNDEMLRKPRRTFVERKQHETTYQESAK